MARVGTTIEHLESGERIVFRETAATTNGELLLLDFFLRPGGHVAVDHVHPNADEHFEIVAGTAGFRIAGRECTATAGQRVVVGKGTPHTWWNAGGDELHAVLGFRPALRMEHFFENFFGLRKAGPTNARGEPPLLPMVVLLREFEPEIYLARPPLAVQRAVLGPLAALGRALGRKARYPEFESGSDPAEHGEEARKALAIVR
jgi:mannose-6-phosphate isomerase-like protein (cupin superfamily)